MLIEIHHCYCSNRVRASKAAIDAEIFFVKFFGWLVGLVFFPSADV